MFVHFTPRISVNFGVIIKDLKFAVNSIWQIVYEYVENGTEDASLGILLVTSDHSDGLPFANTVFFPL